MKAQEIRTDFIKLFVKKVIGLSVPLEDKRRLISIQNKAYSSYQEITSMEMNLVQENKIQEAKQGQEVKQENVMHKTIMEKEKINPLELPYPFISPISQRKPLIKEQHMMVNQRMPPVIKRTEIAPPSVPKPSKPAIPKPSLSRPSNMQKIEINSLAKIDSLLNDSAVQTIECPGPGKQILVYKAGVIQTTNLSLASEEINNVMKEISEKTRIPIVSGIFKAAFGDFITTAVISDFVGTRFMIQKKAAMQQP